MNEWCKKTPLEWQALLHKELKVCAHEKQQHQGWLFTVDPVSANIVLVSFEPDGKASIVTVMGHAVETVEVLNEGSDAISNRLVSLFMPVAPQKHSKEELESKKRSLKEWLEKNHIPVSEQGNSPETLCVAGVLKIDAPYRAEDCSGANEIILSRVQNLINNNPTAHTK
ncbi:gem-associated protein 6 [Erpetoichthys calabaricus]|uniref:Gem-associated protein 6 n=1 Tax=Erpetoichthys calabaricus TaxID=27687 RepID=A0A8C4TGF9_ERPCA|nr:gem-associated protein 6 [Erpetoichthys calabaricus]